MGCDTDGQTECIKAVSADDYYRGLLWFLQDGAGTRYRTNVKWVDEDCEHSTNTTWKGCRYQDGVKASRMNCNVKGSVVVDGTQRYATMTAMRKEIKVISPEAFPYNFAFLYWEEVGVIGGELSRNLGICAAVIVCVVMALLPKPRISLWVVICIVMSCVDLVGFLHWWGVTISGVSTIYILICIGLAVDYAAHIAHCFSTCSGTSKERAVKALERIGPSTFNAVVSTFLAVVVLSTSSSYVFRIFFKSLALVTVLGGLHGLWLLPVILSVVGGDKEEEEEDSKTDVTASGGKVEPTSSDVRSPPLEIA